MKYTQSLPIIPPNHCLECRHNHSQDSTWYWVLPSLVLLVPVFFWDFEQVRLWCLLYVYLRHWIIWGFIPKCRLTVLSIMKSALKRKFVVIPHSSGLGMVKRWVSNFSKFFSEFHFSLNNIWILLTFWGKKNQVDIYKNLLVREKMLEVYLSTKKGKLCPQIKVKSFYSLCFTNNWYNVHKSVSTISSYAAVWDNSGFTFS